MLFRSCLVTLVNTCSPNWLEQAASCCYEVTLSKNSFTKNVEQHQQCKTTGQFWDFCSYFRLVWSKHLKIHISVFTLSNLSTCRFQLQYILISLNESDMSTSVHSYTSKFPVFSFLYYEGIYRGVYVSFIWFIYHFIPKNIKKKNLAVDRIFW